MSKNISAGVLNAIENSPGGISNLELLGSLELCDQNTLKTSLSRLNKAGKIMRLKRGLHSSNPLRDPFVAGQELFGGYLGFTNALYLHKIITEMPFRITVVTSTASSTKAIGSYEFKTVALHEKAVGFVRLGDYVVSTRAKTLFDCVYQQRYSIEEKKLIQAFKEADLKEAEWKEYETYVKKFINEKKAGRFRDIETKIRG
jgi:predicted transcriptional regulator of viral defense system